ncbi:hypothetical protein [uncultured Prevotella sp.]|uniref:hypothetical protein n=1 Tax=uncultured Prevotella sp. TaxID=159272 RepID=UPI0027E39481|nr:hypothetical protein [uncultured Prevotella sp.]
MKLSQDYFDARTQAMKWLALPVNKRNFAVGLQILGKSGYKPNVHAMLVRKGEQPWTVDKLTTCLRDVIQVYYNPDDPRFAEVPDVDDLNDRDGEHQSVNEQESMAKSADTTSFKQMPEVMQLVVKAYADAYKQRAKLARQRTEIGENNDDESVARRKQIGEQMDQLTSYMDALAPLKEAYDHDGTVPDRATFDSIKNYSMVTKCMAAFDQRPKVTVGKVDYHLMYTVQLRTRRKSLTNQITRKENQLLYQSNSKQAVENPMPDSPKRVKLLKQIESLKAERSKVEYELAERQ